MHPLFKCRALRDVRISYSGNADRACRFCDQVANDGRIFKMVLRDAEIANVMPEAFGPVPETIGGLLQKEAEKVWWKWNPVIWGVIKSRGCFGSAHHDHRPGLPLDIGFLRKMLIQYRNRHSV